MTKFTYLKDVVTLKLDEQKCNGCRMCTVVCPHNVFAIENKRARIISKDSCMECGACQLNCPENAISVRSGVGCAAGIIAGILNKTNSACCSNTNSNCC
jgi:NAD-dependent dihydropyrimidine dehydrogenase PreA subunit